MAKTYRPHATRKETKPGRVFQETRRERIREKRAFLNS